MGGGTFYYSTTQPKATLLADNICQLRFRDGLWECEHLEAVVRSLLVRERKRDQLELAKGRSNERYSEGHVRPTGPRRLCRRERRVGRLKSKRHCSAEVSRSVLKSENDEARTCDNRIPNDGCWTRCDATRHQERADVKLLECAVDTACPAELLVELDSIEVCLIHSCVLGCNEPMVLDELRSNTESQRSIC